ncbi:MAG: hypothetical protein SOX11_07705 [Lachnospiraceae bacterium]|nr:hypothetical protein [Lachnospiraceae bacterium]MDY3223012.1 hypothetical protein [Lachnospiraceae bacterium]
MEKIEGEDYDIFLLQVKKQMIPTLKEDRRKADTGMGFVFPLPETFHRASEEERESIFWSAQRPEVVFLTENKRAGISFQLLEEWKEKKLEEGLEEVRQVLERLDQRTVFYEQGERGAETPVFWIDYKSFAKRESLYHLAFLFHHKGKIILGTFFCLFERKRQIARLN